VTNHYLAEQIKAVIILKSAQPRLATANYNQKNTKTGLIISELKSQ
jgi:hypothetical protein